MLMEKHTKSILLGVLPFTLGIIVYSMYSKKPVLIGSAEKSCLVEVDED